MLLLYVYSNLYLAGVSVGEVNATKARHPLVVVQAPTSRKINKSDVLARNDLEHDHQWLSNADAMRLRVLQVIPHRSGCLNRGVLIRDPRCHLVPSGYDLTNRVETEVSNVII